MRRLFSLLNVGNKEHSPVEPHHHLEVNFSNEQVCLMEEEKQQQKDFSLTCSDRA